MEKDLKDLLTEILENQVILYAKIDKVAKSQKGITGSGGEIREAKRDMDNLRKQFLKLS